MKPFKESSHSFILRIWLEPREIPRAIPEWRAVIEHVGSGEKLYLKDLRQVEAFIEPYLGKMLTVS